MSKKRFGPNGRREGPLNPNARLTIRDVRNIRAHHAAGCSARWIARRMGVHSSTIDNVVNGKSWRDL